jgi:hypothetical protein
MGAMWVRDFGETHIQTEAQEITQVWSALVSIWGRMETRMIEVTIVLTKC